MPLWAAFKLDQVPRASRRLLPSLFLLTLVCTAGWGYMRWSGQRTEYFRLVDRQALLQLQGVRMPTLVATLATGAPYELDEGQLQGVSIIWIVSKSDCLMCLAESANFKQLVEDWPGIQVFLVGLEGDHDFYSELRTSERLPFPIIVDSAGSILNRLGLANFTPYKLLVADGVIFSAERGTPPVDVRFHERVEILARHIYSSTKQE